MKTEVRLDPVQFLAIDAAAEARKLARAQIEGAWQVPAEVVRLFLGAGAGHVSVHLGRMSFEVEADRPGIDPALRHHLAALLDEGTSPAARHRSLVALEAAGALALIALAGLPHRHLSIDESGTVIEVRGLRYDRGRAARFLEGACRFAGAPVWLEGRPTARGFDDVLGEAILAPPFSGRIAIPARGEAARLWLLVHGVVAAHLTVPGVPCFEAAIEMREQVAAPGSAAALREAIVAHVPDLVERALELLLALGGEIRGFGDADQRRLRELLLRAAREHRQALDLFRLPVFRALVGARAEERWLSLLDVGSVSPGALLALYPEQDPAAFALPSQPVVIVDAQERSQLGELLGLRFALPPRRPGVHRFRRFVVASAGTAKRGLHRLLHGRRRAIADDGLSADERALLRELRGLVPDADVRLCAGGGPIRRVRGQKRGWLLPRENPAVAASARALARDPAWAYPTCLALLERLEPLPESARTRWLQRTPAVRG